MNYPNSEIGLIGLAVMGQNLALNIADHGFKISVFNRTYSKTLDFLQENDGLQNLSGFETINEFVDSLARPRKIIIMVQAGKATDGSLIHSSSSRRIGRRDRWRNAKWTDTILERRRGSKTSIS